jgi:siderophore synthetase component
VPDDADYEALRWLLEHPREWSAEDLAAVRFMIETQRAAIADAHPRDERSRANYAGMLDELEAALRVHLETRG